MELSTLFQQLGIALGLGLLVGLQRERAASPLAGVRTFPLKAALFFGLLYAAVLFAAAAARERFGSQGLYVVAALSGLTDVDAITLSTAQLVNAGRLEAGSGWRVILLAALSNLLFKAGAVAVLGQRQLLLKIAALYGVALAVGLGLLLWWPR